MHDVLRFPSRRMRSLRRRRMLRLWRLRIATLLLVEWRGCPAWVWVAELLAESWAALVTRLHRSCNRNALSEVRWRATVLRIKVGLPSRLRRWFLMRRLRPTLLLRTRRPRHSMIFL